VNPSRNALKFAKLKALALGAGLFLAVYVPAFVITAFVRPRVELGIALIMTITLLLAVLFVFLLGGTCGSFAEFGFRKATLQYVGIGVASGLVFGLVAAFVSHLFPSKPPFDVSSFAPWKIGLYFIVGASIQEEVIFRGLIQSMVEKRWSAIISIRGASISYAVAFTAILFGVVHLEVGAVVAVSAFILGIVAGELRRRSGSLLPAIIVHALFNCADAAWH
jgi:membrane protease YdiL (CAAX protease family)